MKVLIIEDEFPAAKRLKQLLLRSGHQMDILEVLDSVESGKNWFANNQDPDLIFSDIQLSDGLSFEIYEAIQLRCPIIFTTAYDEYAIKAFKLNSIDYLVKPIQPADLRNALDQFNELDQKKPYENNDAIQKLLSELQSNTKSYKERFLVKTTDALVPIFEHEIAYFVSAHEITTLVRRDGKRFTVENTLADLEAVLNPASFYRANRQYIVHAGVIQRVYPYFNGRLVIDLVPKAREEVIVSKSKASDFKNWFGQEAA